MSKLTEAFEAALIHMIADVDGREVRSIEEYEEDIEYSGGCETCYFEWTIIRVVYIDTEGTSREFRYSGSFGSLIEDLDRYSE